ncbi:MAG: cytochrome C oxidase subunit I [Bacteroidia bacterium]|nr:cytochrome c oxidase subunit I [Bacteroidia bacterium]MCZ2277760.1 cytochrome C oxidase subunit I [Bacteroidia bacterium]
MFPALSNPAIKTTSYKVVIPFYIYAALSFLIACILLLTSGGAFLKHYFHPHVLAITHTMALGWGTMIILGASHQLVPVLIEGKLYSDKLAYTSFFLAAAGIPLLVYAFYQFDMGAPAKWGGRLVLLAILAYLINIIMSMSQSKSENVHSVFVFTATLWLLFTVSLGLVLVYNFTYDLMPRDPLHYLPLHAHAGIIGWFLLLVIGVGSRLIPLFLISKYTNQRLLWIIFGLINTALLIYLLIFYVTNVKGLTSIPALLILLATLLFIYYCRQAYKKRLRKQVDDQVKISILSVFMLLLPIILLLILIVMLLYSKGEKINIILTYGFMIFFGWLTAIILGMTFKTLPFIVWNKVYRKRSAAGKTPSPKDMFSHPVFKIMGITYLAGFTLFATGILTSFFLLLNAGAILLIITAALYNWNILKVVNHKPVLK